MGNTQSTSNWSSKSLGGVWKHAFFVGVIRFGGVIPAYIALFFVVLWYAMVPSVRQRATPYLTRRFSDDSLWMRFVRTFLLYFAFGKTLLDRMIFRTIGRGSVSALATDQAQIHSLLELGRGVIVLSGHVGCWQTALAGLTFANVPLNVLLFMEEGNVDKHFFEAGGQGPAVNVIDSSGPFGGMIEMMKALKRNEIVCVMGDRSLAEDKNLVSVPFLGESVRFPLFPITMAAATGAAIAIMFTLRDGPCKARAHVFDSFTVPSEVGKDPEACRPFVQRFVTSLERIAWLHPYQMFNFFDMWK